MFSLKNGNTLPTFNYDLSISENFPVIDRSYKVDSSIMSRSHRSYLPINANINSGSIDENYIEFIINSNEQEFIDTSSFSLEMKIKIVDEIGSSLNENSKISLIDAFPLMLLRKVNMSLNSVSIENHSNFGLVNTIHSYLNMDKSLLSTIGENMFFKKLDENINDKLTESDFSNGDKNAHDIKKTMHFMVPLRFDISNLNFFLLNGVNIGIRIDLAQASLLINSLDTKRYSYNVQSCKLWMQKVTPNPEALISLNKTMLQYNKTIEYIYERPIVKQFVYPKGHTLITLDDIFNGVVPHRIITFFIRQKALNGAYDYNGLYLNHCNISSIDLDINGCNIASLKGTFPNEVAQIFNHTLINLNNNQNLLSLQSFRDGRMINVWNLQSSLCDDVLHIEKSGNIRLNIQSKQPLDDNYIVFVIGVTTGAFDIDGLRRVKTSFIL